MAASPRIAGPAGWRSKQDSILVGALAVVLSVLVGIAMVKLGTVQRELKAILIVVAGLAMVAAALRPQFGLAMLLALIPFEYHFSGTGTDEVLIVAFALVLMWRIAWRALPPWIATGGVALVLGSFAAAIGAVDRTSALWGAVRWLSVILIMFAAFNVLRERGDASRRMIDIFTGSAVVVVGFAFAQKVGVYLLVGAPYVPGQPDSFFGYYTVYAGYVAIAAVLATGELLIALTEHRGRRISLYGVALLVILVGVAISTSRGGLLSLGGGWLLLLAFNIRRGPVFVRGLVILVIFAGAAYLAAPPSTVSKFEQRIVASKGTISGEDKTRFALQKAGEQALREYPFGLGYENFPFYLRGHVRSMQIQMVFDHAHETPVQIGLDAGWLGLLGFLILWGCPIGLVIARRGGGTSAVRASACAAALGGFMAQGLFDYLFYEIAFLLFFVTLVWGAAHALSVDRRGMRIPAISSAS
jgi:O-antigen ligase